MKKIKKSWVKILSLALVAVLGFAVIGGIAGFATRDTRTIPSTSFSRGGLDDKGIHVDTKQSIYTKEAFECSGLKIEQDFESHATYDVYYYDYDGNFLKSDKGLSGNYTADSKFTLAKCARIVIHPEIPVDEKEYEIGYFEVYGIAKNVKITVAKDSSYQYSDSKNLYEEDSVIKSTDTKTITLSLLDEDSEATFNKYDVWVKVTTTGDSSVIVTMSGETVVDADIKQSGWTVYTFEVPEECPVNCSLTIPLSADCYIFGYN